MTAMPLDPSQDPDRYLPDPAAPTVPLDLSKDPDRFDAAAPPTGKTLPELLAESGTGQERNNLEWLVGLASVVGFLVLVSFLLSHLR